MRDTVRRFARPDGKREVLICRLSNGFYSWEELFEDQEDMTEFSLGIDTYWSMASSAGLYDSAAAAERDARASIPWLRASPG